MPDHTPFLKIVLPALAGVVAARLVSVPWWAAAACALVVFACAVAVRQKPWADIYVWASVMLFFFAVGTAALRESRLPSGERVRMVAQIAERPYARGRWSATTAHVGYCSAGDGVWTRVDERIQLMVDTCYRVRVGEQIAFRGWVNPVDTTDSSYGRLMHLRGQHSRVWLVPGNLLRVAPHISRTPVYYAARLQEHAIERLSRLDISPDRLGVVTAMTAGDKRGVDRGVRGSYSATGAAHLLAVSGLHVGIVFVLVNLLLYLLPTVRRGHIVKNIAAILAIWLYAAAAGLAPSVVRAALMFSFAQLALASGSYRNGLNIMLGSAVVMLALNPNYWGDPSFMLSYAAVLSIAAFFRPLYRLVRTRFAVVNALLSVVVVGVVASLGTAPLVAYWFGNIPLAGMVINPPVILTAHVIVMCGVLWVIAPVGPLGPLFSGVLDFAAGVQNAIVDWSARLPWAAVHVPNMPLGVVVIIYCCYIALAMWAYQTDNPKSNMHTD